MSDGIANTVLIAEDDPISSMVLRKALQNRGYEVISANDGEEAWEILQSKPIRMVISDWMMPRMDGLSLCRQIRSAANPQYTYFILLTAKTQRDERAEGMEAGVDDYLTKPLDTNELDARLCVARRILEMQGELYRLSLVASKTSCGVIITDKAGQTEWVNPSFVKMCGYTLEELKGQKPGLLLQTQATDSSVVEEMRDGVESHSGFSVEVLNQTKQGEPYWAALECTPIFNETGEVVQYIAVATDVTERKRQQEQIRRQFERITALKAIDIAVNYSRDLPLTLSILLEQIPAHLGIDAAAILAIDTRRRRLEFAAGRGFRTALIKSRTAEIECQEQDIAPLMVAGFTRGGCQSTQAHQPNTELMDVEEFQSYEAISLENMGQVVGLLELYHRGPLDLNADQMEFLATVAGQASIAIDNARLLSDLQQSNNEIALAYDATIEGWSRALDLRDNETEGHSQRVTDLTLRLARSMGFSDDDLVHVRRGALLHDIGKMGIPDAILLKPGPLSDEQWDVMRQHPAYAHRMLYPIVFLRPALDIPYCHHEKYDGSGYPRGLKGDQIPLSARIFAIVDVWDALRSKRPYREAWPYQRVVDHLRSLTGTHFDPIVVDAFLKLVDADQEEYLCQVA